MAEEEVKNLETTEEIVEEVVETAEPEKFAKSGKKSKKSSKNFWLFSIYFANLIISSSNMNKQKVSNSPSLSFIALFAFLVLLLAVDLFLIYWRKQMGCGTLINNGISRRKVRDDLVDYPENTQSSDLEDAIAENEQKE